MNYRILFAISFLLFSSFVFSQKLEISGVTYDEKGAPLPMTTVTVKGGTSGTVADINGVFTINARTTDTLSFTFVGYKTQDIPVDGRTKLKVNMVSSATSLEDVVVIAYGKTTRADLVGSVAAVEGTELRKTGLNNVSHMIQDALPGVYTEIQSGQPGRDDADIIVRGKASWNGDNSPLILIDGVEASGGFSQINVDEIASISVLKDAASTAVYGVRGADGVILITTRRGNTGKPTIKASMNVTAKTVAELPDQLGSYDVLTLGQEAMMNSRDYAALRPQWYIDKFNDPNRNIYAYPDVDWYDEMLKSVGWEQNYRVSVSGGTDFVKYFTSFSKDHVGDVVNNEAVDGYYDPRFTFDKTTFRSNLDFNLSKSTKLRVDIAGRSEYTKTPDTDVDATDFSNVFKYIDEATPYLFPVYYPEEFVLSHPDPLMPNASGIRLAAANNENPYQFNPYNAINYSGMRKTKKDVADITLGLEQDLNRIVKGLKFSATFNYSNYYQYKKTDRWTNDFYLYDAQFDEWRTERSGLTYNSKAYEFHSSGGESYNYTQRNIFYEAKLLYNRSFGLHNVGGTAVFNRTQLQYGYNEFPHFREDWVGRVSYDYNKKYYFKASAGYNGTDKFAQGKRFGFFPSAAVAWNIANESFIKDRFDAINMLKLRYSYGKTGNDRNVARYLYEGGWSGLPSNYGYSTFGDPMSSTLIRYVESKIPNEDATWETAYKQNLGLDIVLNPGTGSSQIDLSTEFYSEEREGIYYWIPMPSYYHPKLGKGKGVGNIGPPQVNIGETKNHGIEFNGSYSQTLSSGFSYKIGGNFTLAESRVVYKADPENKPDYQKQAGKPIGWNSGYQTNGYINDFETAIYSPEITGGNSTGNYSYVDFNGDGKIDQNDKIPLNGISEAALVYGIHGSCSFKGLSLSIRFFGKEGVYYGASNYYPNFNEFLLEAKTAHLDTWSPENTDAAFPAFRNTGSKMYESSNDQNILDASYLKLKNVTLSYLLQSRYISEMLHIHSINLSLSGDNLHTWSEIPFGDPEGGNGFSGGYGNYPLVRRFIFTMAMNF